MIRLEELTVNASCYLSADFEKLRARLATTVDGLSAADPPRGCRPTPRIRSRDAALHRATGRRFWQELPAELTGYVAEACSPAPVDHLGRPQQKLREPAWLDQLRSIADRTWRVARRHGFCGAGEPGPRCVNMRPSSRRSPLLASRRPPSDAAPPAWNGYLGLDSGRISRLINDLPRRTVWRRAG